jgi:hypothetical protein
MKTIMCVSLTLALAAFPAAASAATDYSGTLSNVSTSFAWSGEGSGLPLDAVGAFDFAAEISETASPFACDGVQHDCEYALLDVIHPGDVTIDAAADDVQAFAEPTGVVGGASVPDIDLSLYAADAAGNPTGDSLTGTDCATAAERETCTAKDLAAGKYVVEVSFFLADGATYSASAALATLVPVESARSGKRSSKRAKHRRSHRRVSAKR